jgi:hypothetical protein
VVRPSGELGTGREQSGVQSPDLESGGQRRSQQHASGNRGYGIRVLVAAGGETSSGSTPTGLPGIRTAATVARARDCCRSASVTPNGARRCRCFVFAGLAPRAWVVARSGEVRLTSGALGATIRTPAPIPPRPVRGLVHRCGKWNHRGGVIHPAPRTLAVVATLRPRGVGILPADACAAR